MSGLRANLKRFLTEKSACFVFWFLLVQPVMDVVSFWCDEFGISAVVTLAMRLLAVGISAAWGFCISDRKWRYYVCAGVLLTLLAGHAIACYQVGYLDLVSDASNFIRVAQMPVLVLAFADCLCKNSRTLSAAFAGGAAAFVIILLVEGLSIVTGTDPHTYTDGTGVLGWFNNTNSQSAILCMLAVFFLYWLIKNECHIALFVPAVLLVGVVLYFFGTRLAYAGIFAATVGLSVSLLLINRRAWRYIAAMMGCALIFLSLYFVSPMYTHQKGYEIVQHERQEQTNEAIMNDPDLVLPPEQNAGNEEEPITPEMEEEQYRLLVEKLTPIYETYVGDFVEIFGAEETMKMYNYTTDPFEFSNLRQKKLMYSEALMDRSPAMSHLFGLELARFHVGESIFDVENDFHGIYYLYGIVGLVCYLGFLLYFVGLIAWALWKKARRYFTMEAASAGIALVVCLLHAYNTAAVLRRPNASIWLSLLLALIYYLVRAHRYEDAATTCKEATEE